MSWKRLYSSPFLWSLCKFFQRKLKAQNSSKNEMTKNRLPTFMKMEGTDLFSPPETVSGMRILDKNAFNKVVKITCIEVKHEGKEIVPVICSLKKYFLKVPGIQSIERLETKTKILLDPYKVKTYHDFDEDTQAELAKHDITCNNMDETYLQLTYENFRSESILKAVLPKHLPSLSSYSLIGHIIHLNIKDHLLDYKYIIGQILLDKVKQAKTVVNKTTMINNVYRNFQMEILCGDPNLTVSVVEYGVKYEFDFSKVYWNPRLSTEHDRIVSMLKPGDALFDVFAGVGPFSIRAALKKCLVFANDLNPDSFKWLNHNINLNKKSKTFITTYNKDGKDFILEDIKFNLLKLWDSCDFHGRIYIVMNLPACGLQFLKFFKGLIARTHLSAASVAKVEKSLPIVHCHFFVKEPETAVEVIQNNSDIHFSTDQNKLIHFVRNVSLGKGMYRLTFQMPETYLLAECQESGEPLSKRICL